MQIFSTMHTQRGDDYFFLLLSIYYMHKHMSFLRAMDTY